MHRYVALVELGSELTAKKAEHYCRDSKQASTSTDNRPRTRNGLANSGTVAILCHTDRFHLLLGQLLVKQDRNHRGHEGE